MLVHMNYLSHLRMFPFNKLKSDTEKLKKRDCDSSDIQKFIREYEHKSSQAEETLRKKQAKE